MHQLPATGFLRIKQIVGDPKADPPIPAVIPVSKSTWWAGVRSGRYPKPINLSPRTTVWAVGDIRALIERLSNPAPQVAAPATWRSERGCK